MAHTIDIRIFAKEKGADLVGVASIERFKNAPPRHRPQYFMSDAKCIVSLGIHVNDALVEALRRRRSVYSYQLYVEKYIVDQLNEIAYRVARFLEDQRCSAYPVPTVNPIDPWSLEGDIAHKYAAVAAGLGLIGWSNLFLSPQFGPRQRLTSVITNASLESDPLFEGELCDPSRCGFRCTVCPTGAISKIEKTTFRIGDKEFEHGRFSNWRCLWGCGSFSSLMPMPTTEPAIEDLRIGKIAQELEKFKRRGSLDEDTVNSIHFTRINKKEILWCWLSCMTSCPIGQTKP